MTLHPMMPFALDMNLGRAYNEAMALLPSDGWACFLDHDAMWTTKQWYGQIIEAIKCRPDAGAFTAVTNRIASPWQQVGHQNDHNMARHYEMGNKRLAIRTLLDITDTNGFGGVVMVVSKRAWERVGGFADGLLCVDHSLHFRARAAGLRTYLIEGLYVYHRRRAFGAELPRNTPMAADCPCRGPEVKPTVRVDMSQAGALV